MTTSASGPSAADWRAFQDAVDGEVVLPGSARYEAVRRPAIARFHDSRPLAVVRCRTPADVAESIALARGHGVPAAPRSGGHCFAGRSSTPGIVVDVSPMRSVSVSGDTVTVGAGARLGEIYDSLTGHGLTIPAGCGPTVGIAGLTLGGGFGILGRSHGLAADRLLAARVVLADGRVVDCDEHHDADLFWGLRGAGGGNLGVVTSLTFRGVPAPSVTTFHLVWPRAHAERVIDAWQGWAPAAPDELAASLLITADGDAGRPPVVNLFGAMAGTESATTALLGELAGRAGADPESAAIIRTTYAQAKRQLAELGARMAGPPPDDGYTVSKSEYFGRPLPFEAIVTLMARFDDARVQGQSRELDFTPWGGAYNRVPVQATAFAHRDATFLLKHATVVDAGAPAAERAAARHWLAGSHALVHRWGTGGAYPNFPDADLTAWARAYHGANYARLLRVKATYDPDGFFRFRQAIGS